MKVGGGSRTLCHATLLQLQMCGHVCRFNESNPGRAGVNAWHVLLHCECAAV